MSSGITEQSKTVRAPAPRKSTARTKTLVLLAFAAVYVVWGSTYLAIRVGIESFPPFILAGIRHVTAGLVLYAVLPAKDRDSPDEGALVDGSGHRFSAAVHREWRGELGGADRAFRYRGAAGRYRIAVAGDIRLAPPGRNPAGCQSYDGTADGIWGTGAAGRSSAPGRFRAGRSARCRSPDGRLAGVGLGFALFEAPRQARCSHVERGDAEPRGWRGALDCRRVYGRIPRTPFCCGIHKVVAGAPLSHRLRIGLRIQRLCLPSGKEHPRSRGNIRVCEHRRGIVSRLAHRC